MNQGQIKNLNQAYEALNVDMVAMQQLPAPLESILRADVETWLNALQVHSDLKEMCSKDGLLTSVLEHLDLLPDTTKPAAIVQAIEEASRMAEFCAKRAAAARDLFLGNSLGRVLFLIGIFNKYSKACLLAEYFDALRTIRVVNMADPDYLLAVSEAIKELNVKSPPDVDALIASFNSDSKDFSYLKILSKSQLHLLTHHVRTSADRLGVTEVEFDEPAPMGAKGVQV